MRLRTLVITSIFATLSLGAPALAQDSTGIASELERTASTSPEEKVAYASASNEEIDDALAQTSKVLETAKREGDAAEIQCVTIRHASIKALQSVSQRAAVDMKTALVDGASDKANHEFRKIAVAVSKTRMLLAEAQQCLSGQIDASGSTETVVTIDDDVSISDEDPLRIDETDLGFDPPDVSPYL